MFTGFSQQSPRVCHMCDHVTLHTPAVKVTSNGDDGLQNFLVQFQLIYSKHYYANVLKLKLQKEEGKKSNREYNCSTYKCVKYVCYVGCCCNQNILFLLY